MGSKRPSEDELPHTTKVPKIEPGLATASPLPPQQHVLPHSDFSSSVKKKLASSSRTGQACDRCKIRKIRCDPRPEGCSPCAQNRTPCKTTDRITGRATTRGHTEATEAENNYLRAHVAELQAQLKELGCEPRPPPAYTNYSFPPPPPLSAAAAAASAASSAPWPPASATSPWPNNANRAASTSPLPGYVPASARALENSRPLPQFKHNCFGDNYLGVSSADSLLSNISGTSLSVFGHEIDITDFVADKDYDDSYMSYNYVMRVALNVEQVDHVDLPPYNVLKDYSTWFLRSMHPYLMLFDKPTLMNLIWRIGHEPGFTPSIAENVGVHMVIASLTYQISVRNREASLMDESHRHYRYALSFFKDLWLSHTWQDVQALTLIVHHLRNFPKPGAAWIMASTTFQLAIELGYHRSAKAWADGPNLSNLEVEIRKRTFWTLYALTTNLSGKLGRPMLISLNDIDVEFPEPVDDSLPGDDTGLDAFHRCSFQVGIQVAKFTIPLSQLYRTLYSINASPQTYEDNLKRLEAGIRQWREEIPVELRDPATASQDDYIFALYLEYWYQEYHLHMYHPAMCRSKDAAAINSNMDKCLQASQKLLHACIAMKKTRSLDNTWINIVTYVAAMFTTLFVYYQRRDRISSVDMEKLRIDMNEWVDLTGESGQLLGSGDKLKDALSQVVERSLSSINESIFKRTASQSLAQVAMQAPTDSSASSNHTNGNPRPSYQGAPTTTTESTAIPSPNQTYAGSSTDATYSYSNGTPAPMPQQTTSGFGQQVYSGDPDAAMAPSHAAALQAAASGTNTQAANDPFAYTNAQSATSAHHAAYANEMPADWHQWTRTAITYAQQPGPQGDYLNTASTLMALGGREGVSQGPSQGGQASGEGPVSHTHGLGSNHGIWPSTLFNVPSNGYPHQ